MVNPLDAETVELVKSLHQVWSQGGTLSEYSTIRDRIIAETERLDLCTMALSTVLQATLKTSPALDCTSDPKWLEFLSLAAQNDTKEEAHSQSDRATNPKTRKAGYNEKHRLRSIAAIGALWSLEVLVYYGWDRVGLSQVSRIHACAVQYPRFRADLCPRLNMVLFQRHCDAIRLGRSKNLNEAPLQPFRDFDLHALSSVTTDEEQLREWLASEDGVVWIDGNGTLLKDARPVHFRQYLLMIDAFGVLTARGEKAINCGTPVQMSMAAQTSSPFDESLFGTQSFNLSDSVGSPGSMRHYVAGDFELGSAFFLPQIATGSLSRSVTPIAASTSPGEQLLSPGTDMNACEASLQDTPPTISPWLLIQSSHTYPFTLSLPTPHSNLEITPPRTRNCSPFPSPSESWNGEVPTSGLRFSGDLAESQDINHFHDRRSHSVNMEQNAPDTAYAAKRFGNHQLNNISKKRAHASEPSTMYCRKRHATSGTSSTDSRSIRVSPHHVSRLATAGSDEYFWEELQYPRRIDEEADAAMGDQNMSARSQWLSSAVPAKIRFANKTSGTGTTMHHEQIADALSFSAADFIKAAETHKRFTKPIIIQESFTDTGMHSIDDYVLQLLDIGSDNHTQDAAPENQREIQGKCCTDLKHIVRNIKSAGVMERDTNYLVVRNLTKSHRPRFTMLRRFRLLEVLVEKFRTGKDRACEEDQADPANCAAFNILGSAGAFSKPRMNACWGTWYRVLQGSVVCMMVPESEMEYNWSSFFEAPDTWVPRTNAKKICIKENQVLVIPPGLRCLHAMQFCTDSLIEGGLIWDGQNISIVFETIHSVAQKVLPSLVRTNVLTKLDDEINIVLDQQCSWMASNEFIKVWNTLLTELKQRE